MFLFPQRLRNQRAAADAEHIANGTHDIQHGHDQVDRRKFRLPGKIGDKKSVRNDIQGGEQIHHYGRQCELQQLAVCKMLR